MSAGPLVIIAPRLPPQACGIGTYAWHLNDHWPTDSSAHRFLVRADAMASREHLGTSAIASFPPSSRGLADALEEQDTADVLLHYAGRAYHRYGFPRWMPAAFSRWLARDSARRLHVIFHELPADLPLFSKQGVLQRLSFPVAQKLAEQASTVITNSAHHASVLQQWRLRSPVQWFPVPSNIPAPAVAARSPKATGEFVIFGLPYTRLETLRIFREFLKRWKESGRLTKLHLIGPSDGKFSPQADAIIAAILRADDVCDHGELAASKVSELLRLAEFCLSISNEATWSKSGSFMAYAAHGAAVVLAEPAAHGPLAFTVPARELEMTNPAVAQEKADELRRWYVANAEWGKAARRVAGLIEQR